MAKTDMKITDGNGNTIVLPLQLIIYMIGLILTLGGQILLLALMREDVADLKLTTTSVMVQTATLAANQNALRDRLSALEHRPYKEGQ